MKRLFAIFLSAAVVIAMAFCLVACGETEPPTPPAPTATEGLEYTELIDGTYSVSAGMATEVDHIVIPATYQDNPVTMIAKEGFKECTSVVKVTLPDGLTDIGSKAFYDCTNLQEIIIPSSVKNIGDTAFAGCESLVRLTISGGNLKQIGHTVFSRCESLTAVRALRVSAFPMA